MFITLSLALRSTSSSRGTDASAFTGYRSWCVTNQILLWVVHIIKYSLYTFFAFCDSLVCIVKVYVLFDLACCNPSLADSQVQTGSFCGRPLGLPPSKPSSLQSSPQSNLSSLQKSPPPMCECSCVAVTLSLNLSTCLCFFLSSFCLLPVFHILYLRLTLGLAKDELSSPILVSPSLCMSFAILHRDKAVLPDWKTFFSLPLLVHTKKQQSHSAATLRCQIASWCSIIEKGVVSNTAWLESRVTFYTCKKWHFVKNRTTSWQQQVITYPIVWQMILYCVSCPLRTSCCL